MLDANDSIGAVGGFSESYSDGGLVGLGAVTNGSDVESTFAVLAATLKAGNLTDDEVARAKAILAGASATEASSQLGRASQYTVNTAAGSNTAADIAVSACIHSWCCRAALFV